MRVFLLLLPCLCFTLPLGAAPGDLDLTFGVQGKVIGDVGGAGGLVIQPDGKLLIAGSVSDYVPGSDRDLAAARLHRDGSMDAGFGTGGVGALGMPEGGLFGANVALQSDGKAVVATWVPTFKGGLLTRFLTNGEPDPGFGVGGRVYGPGMEWDDVVIQTDGKILVCGVVVEPGDRFHALLLRFNADGSPDLAFGENGAVYDIVEGDSNCALGVAVQGDGKIIVAGYRRNADHWDFALARFESSGSRDTGFGSGGMVTSDFEGGDDMAADVVLQPDGKIVLSGLSGGRNERVYKAAVARYLPSGALDGSFGSGGKAAVEVRPELTGNYDWVHIWRRAALQQNGKIVLAAYVTGFTGPDDNRIKLLRFDQAGALDVSFGDEGIVTTELEPVYSDDLGLGIQSDGKIVVSCGVVFAHGGTYSTGFMALRYEGDPTSATVLANGVSGLSPTTATLSGLVNPGGRPTAALFEHGLTDAYGGTASVTLSPADGSSEQQVSVSLVDLTPDTTYHYRLTATNAQGTTSTTRATFKTWGALDSWRFAQFGSGENLGSAADTADFDRDGLPNLLEWACALNPTAGSRLAHGVRREGEDIEFHYARSVAAVNAGTLFTVEWSDSLLGTPWSSAGVTQAVLSADGATQQVRAVLPAGESARRFVRLKVAKP